MKIEVSLYNLSLVIVIMFLTSCNLAKKNIMQENISKEVDVSLVDVDAAIYEKLNVEEEVEVVIILKQGNDEIRKEIINSFAKDEFKLRSDDLNWIDGKITKKGLDKIKNDSRIQKVYVPVPIKLEPGHVIIQNDTIIIS